MLKESRCGSGRRPSHIAPAAPRCAGYASCIRGPLLKPALLNNTLISLTKRSENGQTQKKLDLSKLVTLEEDCTIIKASSELSDPVLPSPMTNVESVTLESPLPIKERISIDKSLTLKKDIQIMRLSQMSPQGLISKEKVCKPFWMLSSKKLSRKLWLPTKTDCQDSLLISFTGCVKNLNANSWFSTKLQTVPQSSKSLKMFCPLLTSSQLKITACDPLRIEKPVKKKKKNFLTEKEKINHSDLLRSRKIKIFPSKEQREKLDKWFGSCRWVYNQCVNYIKCTESIPKEKELRDLFVSGKKLSDFADGVPYDVRDETLRDVIKNIQSNLAKKKKGTIKKFSFKFKKKKNTQSITIRQKHFNRKSGAYAWIMDLVTREPLSYDHDIRILKDSVGDYFFCIVKNKKFRRERQARKFKKSNMEGIVSLDPGIRTFLTAYDPGRKTVLHIGKEIDKMIEKYLERIDILNQKINDLSIPYVKRSKFIKASRKLQRKIKNKIKTFHHQIAKFLCKNYKAIVIPQFNVKSIVMTDLQKKSKRELSILSHYRFREILKSKSEEYKYCKVVEVTEEYTSKTCGKCGNLHESLGSSKNYTCKKCKLEIDRDVNGARNIMIKTLQ